jgi:hypothetical protein
MFAVAWTLSVSAASAATHFCAITCCMIVTIDTLSRWRMYAVQSETQRFRLLHRLLKNLLCADTKEVIEEHVRHMMRWIPHIFIIRRPCLYSIQGAKINRAVAVSAAAAAPANGAPPLLRDSRKDTRCTIQGNVAGLPGRGSLGT